MDMDSLRLAIGILADRQGNPAEYAQILRFTAALHGLTVETVDQLVLCHLADTADQ